MPVRGGEATSRSAARLRLQRSLELRGLLKGPSSTGQPEDNENDSPLDLAVGREAVRCYEAALAQLRPRDREAVLARIELRWSYDELAEALAVAGPEVARTVVTRALSRLVERMSE
jgi:DNA-directed RNA polymerase specialized sigma24 family protein